MPCIRYVTWKIERSGTEKRALCLFGSYKWYGFPKSIHPCISSGITCCNWLFSVFSFKSFLFLRGFHDFFPTSDSYFQSWWFFTRIKVGSPDNFFLEKKRFSSEKTIFRLAVWFFANSSCYIHFVFFAKQLSLYGFCILHEQLPLSHMLYTDCLYRFAETL